MEYHSFLFTFIKYVTKKKVKFPSPYGVSFILIVDGFQIYAPNLYEFPSPYGVSFILTWKEKYYTQDI